MEMFLYFSQILGKPVLDKLGKRLGSLYNIVMKPTPVYPMSDRLIIKRGRLVAGFTEISWDAVAECDEKNGFVRLNIEAKDVEFNNTAKNKDEFTLRCDVFHKLFKNTQDSNIIRADDIHLLRVENELMIAHLGLKKDMLVSWKYIQPLEPDSLSKAKETNFYKKKQAQAQK